MKSFPVPINDLINIAKKIPGMGKRSAEKFAFNILYMQSDDVNELCEMMASLKERMKDCPICGCLTDVVPCPICSNEARRKNTICVVSDTRDVFAMEDTNKYDGLYHVLGGALSPMDGIYPDNLNIKSLIERLNDGSVIEVIIATNPDVTGEATAAYIASIVKPMGIRVTRLAHGMPFGGNLEYVDSVTLSFAMEGRRDI